MTIFVSYARRDAEDVRALVEDLERAGHDVWFDADIQGGQPWWDVIVERIGRCDLFVVALSADYSGSRACRAELTYALALSRPLLPVKVSDVVVELAPEPIEARHVIDYSTRTVESAIVLLRTVAAAPPPPPLPQPLPPPPPPPLSSLARYRARLDAPELPYAEQSALLDELRDHVAVQGTDDVELTVELLSRLRARPDVVESVARQVDELLGRLPRPEGPGPGSRPRPGATAGRDAADGSEATDLLRSLITHLRRERCTPILGSGLTDSLIGSRKVLAQQWARTFEFPMAQRDEDDLPQVAQFVEVMTDPDTLRASLRDHLATQLRARHDGLAAQRVDTSSDLDGILHAAWQEEREGNPGDPHVVLAGLPCPMFLNAHPSGLLVAALRDAGKDPVVDLCRWRPDAYDWPPSPFDVDDGYTPSVARPLVYQVFGSLDVPESLVITEDDYFEFLVGVTQSSDLVPPPVRRALADSALLFLGFGLEDWDVRILLRTLVSQEGARKLAKYTHVAAQIDLTDMVVSPARALRYLERYFGKVRQPSIDIFWGTIDEFSARLVEVWGPADGQP